MKSSPRSVMRSRWAAIGAAVAVSLGGGGVFLASAAPSAPSSVVTIDPVRVLDTRDPVNVGLAGPFVSPVSQKLTVTGSVATTSGAAVVVPAGATGVLLNVTAVGPTANGFISIRPGDATGAPSTSSLNVSANQTVPNSVQVGLPTTGANAGKIDITYDALGTAGPTTDVLIDVVGYLVAGGAGGTGPAGPAGPAGATGPQGPQGTQGTQGVQGIPGPVSSAGNWGVENRNTVGSPVAQLRSGPVTPPGRRCRPPDASVGHGKPQSLPSAAVDEQVTSATRWTSSRPLRHHLGRVQVYNNQENITAAPGNMPSIKLEVDPNRFGIGSNFSTLNFVPDVTLPGVLDRHSMPRRGAVVRNGRCVCRNGV